jgi:hypothetical protein
MTHFLVSETKPEGYKLEDILMLVRNDVLKKATKIMDDRRPEAQAVLDHDLRILGLLNECIAHAENSTKILVKAFGEHVPGKPRIGAA